MTEKAAFNDEHSRPVSEQDDKNRLLFLQQKETLDLFLERGAISQADHDKSLHDLAEKMDIGDN